MKPFPSGLAIIPLVKGVPQAASQEDSWPELSFDGPQVPAEFDRDIDDANVTNDAGSLAGFGRSSSRGSPRNIFFNSDAGYIGKIANSEISSSRQSCLSGIHRPPGPCTTRS